MQRQKMTEAILTAKRTKGLTWAAIAKAARLSEVYTTSACLGENALAFYGDRLVRLMAGGRQ